MDGSGSGHDVALSAWSTGEAADTKRAQYS
jgi:hypothetical protein